MFLPIIPQGGCCKICGDVTHLAKDCTNKGNRGSVVAAGAGYTCKLSQIPNYLFSWSS
jgi:hypothetical protein